MMLIIGILLMLMIIVSFCYQCNKTENFNTSFEQMEKEGVMNEINAQLFDDLTFRDVVVYENDPDGRVGLDKCLDNKVGYCVEYGQTGVAYYYPPLQSDKYYGQVINREPTQQHFDHEKTNEILIFPNLR